MGCVMRQFFRLLPKPHPSRDLALQAIVEAPDGTVVRVDDDPPRTLEQNAAIHACLGEIAKNHEWAGRKWDKEVWKRLMTAAWCRATGQPVTILPALDGMGVDIVFRHTSNLSVKECSELLEYINAWAAEHEHATT